MEIKGYTLHGDYYLADDIIPNVTRKRACEMTQIIDLPNGKKILAHTLSKEELETIPRKERKCGKWYWTSTPSDDIDVYHVNNRGDFYKFSYINIGNGTGGARLGFKNPFLN